MIHHVAFWVSNLENMKRFYTKYFNAKANDIYRNPKTGFNSYFLTFGDGTKLELMQIPTVSETKNNMEKQFLGLAHIAISVGSKEVVDSLTSQLVKDGFEVAGVPRTTGDGYYESSIFDPELNRIEITI